MEELGLRPGRVAHLDHQRIFPEVGEDPAEPRKIFGRVVKRERELQQHRAQASRAMERHRNRRGPVFTSSAVASSSCVNFCQSFAVKRKRGFAADAIDPLRSEFRAKRIVERRVDLDRVEEFGEIRGLVKAVRARRGIDDAAPIGVGPPGGTDEDAARVRLGCGVGRFVSWRQRWIACLDRNERMTLAAAVSIAWHYGAAQRI